MTLAGALLALSCAPQRQNSTPSGSAPGNGGNIVGPGSGGTTQVSPPNGGSVDASGAVRNGGTIAAGDETALGGAPGGSAGAAGNGAAAGNGGGAGSSGAGSNGGMASGGGGAAGGGGVILGGGSKAAGGASASGGVPGTGGTSKAAGGTLSTSASTIPAGPCSTDSQCPTNGHCVTGSCACWDTNQKVCSGTCVDVKYNNNACGDCNNRCPATAPRCDNGTCKCDSPPCAGGGVPAGGTSGNAGASGSGGTPATGGNKATGGVPNTGGNSAAGGATTAGGSTGGGTQLPPLTNATDGWATRYWDCCKPSCGWSAHASKPMQSCGQDNSRLSSVDTQSACQGGSAFMCWDFAPWSVSDYLSYGFAAFNGANCGTCYELQFTGSSQGGDGKSTPPLSGKAMIVQVINTGGLQSNQFDLLIPGGGVGDFNACSNQWGSSDLGPAYGGFRSACNGDKTCVQTKCSTLFSGKPMLKAGCDWYTGWFNAADNPALKYQQITCPSAITSKSGMSG